ncbi:MAG TPA: hypothetical protein VMV94_15950 [Phycisphaerae bacterium]|nr:hypothetical protein [Phycisphaerae bacterium]
MAYRLSAYADLLHALREKGYHLGPVSAYYQGAAPPFVFLRHDLDRFASRAVHMAAAERDLGVKSTYYFRCNARARFPEEDIRFVTDLGHEIGFHYETVDRLEGRADEVPDRFRLELAALRAIADVATATACGTPLSQLPAVHFAKSLDLRELGLMGDPAVDIDFSKVLYITDTGGTFGSRANLRDRSAGKNLRERTPPAKLAQTLNPRLEPLVVLNTHPHRWPLGVAGLLLVRLADLFVNLLAR